MVCTTRKRVNMVTYNGPTPYDAEVQTIKAHLGERHASEVQILAMQIAEGKQEGYRLAKTEDAPLLKALTEIEEAYCTFADKPPHELRPLLLRLDDLRPKWRATLTKATGKE